MRKLKETKESLESEPELFTDYLGVILMDNQLYHTFRPEDKKMITYPFGGNEYSIDREMAFRLRGWVPWRNYQPWIPWSVFSESTYDKRRKTGLLLYRVPKDFDSVKNPIKPMTQDATIKLITPKLEKSIILNPLLKNYRRKQQFQTASNRILILGLAAVLIIVGVLLLTGHLGG